MEPPSTKQKLLLAGLAVLVLLLLVSVIAYTVRPRDTHEHVFTYERDALSEVIPTDPFSTVFSERNEELYRSGDGFTVILKVKNTPENDYETTINKVVLEQAAERTLNYPERRKVVDTKATELRKRIAEFIAPIPVRRSIEIGVDITDGVTDALRNLVLFYLADIEHSLVSSKDPTTVLLFRISDADYRNYRTWTVMPDESPQTAAAAFNEAVTGWLLKDEGPKTRSSLGTGLFNNLNINKDVRRRTIYIFSDGMENNPDLTDVFYPVRTGNRVLPDSSKWPEIDERISAWHSFPDLRYASVRWYFVPHEWKYYRDVQRYWKHVLNEKCNAREAEIIY